MGAIKLDVNVSCPTGYFAVEVLKPDGEVLEGYEAVKSKQESVDSCKYSVSWGDKKFICGDELKACMLRISLYQGSLFSYSLIHANL